MKHLKSYKIFENNSSSINDEINDVLLHMNDYGYSVKIYDYYKDEGKGYLFTNKANINESTHSIKLIKLSNDEMDIEHMSIDNFSELGFQSSGFSFIGDFSNFKGIYMEILESISQLSDYNPKISISNKTIMIILDLGKSSEDSSKLRQAYDLLYERLESVSKEVKINTNYYSQTYNLSIKSKKSSSVEISNVLASLCTQMGSEEAYNWMQNEGKIESISSIRDEINKMGFNIRFKSSYDDSYNLILSEIK